MGIIKHKSFTLIELIVAVGVVGFILPAVFGIFFVMIRQQLVLVAYQTMKYQGDSVQRNIKNILQNRAAYITDSTYNSDTTNTVCPLPLTPTPASSSDIYIKDRDKNSIKLYVTSVFGMNTIASNSAVINPTPYYLTSKDVTIADVVFSCYRINEFTPAIVSTKFTVLKSTAFKDIALSYTFNVRLRNY